MENKMLLMRRLIYIACLIFSLVFISFYGGSLSYMLFFMMVINSVMAVVYILYVYFTLKIYQVIPERKVTKQEYVSYQLMLNNESLIAYRDIKIKLMDELSKVSLEDMGCMGMEPGQGLKLNGTLLCKYSGTYHVGVDSIEIMDYFKILRIRFPMPQKLKVTVKPRVVKTDRISFLPEQEIHNSSLWGSNHYEPDSEVRKYYPGDNKRHIHWKNSAKRAELMVRNLTVEENLQFVVMLDKSFGKCSFAEKTVSCDKMRETLLSLVHYIYTSGYLVKVFLDTDYEKEIGGARDFKELYQRVADESFTGEGGLDRTLSMADERYEANLPFVIITSKHSALNQNKFKNQKQLRSSCGRMLSVINVDLYETVEDVLLGNREVKENGVG